MSRINSKFIKIMVALTLGLGSGAPIYSQLFANTNNVYAESEISTIKYSYEDVLKDTHTIVLNSVEKWGATHTFFKTSMEWTILGLARDLNNSGVNTVFDKYIADNNAYFVKNDGKIENTTATTYDKIILTYSALGKNASDIAGFNLLDQLDTFKKVSNQGINGVIFTLLALDSNPNLRLSATADYTKESLVTYLIKNQKANGGWTLFGDGADPDITGFVLQALAPYKNQPAVASSLDNAVTFLSNLQSETGGYSMPGWGTEVNPDNANSVAQVITGLSSIGVDPTGTAFTKNNVSAVDNLLSFYIPGKGFKYTQDETTSNGMALDQAYYTLVAYDRFVKNKNTLYDMSDVGLSEPTTPETPVDPGKDSEKTPESNDSTEETNNIHEENSTDKPVTGTESTKPEEITTPTEEIPTVDSPTRELVTQTISYIPDSKTTFNLASALASPDLLATNSSEKDPKTSTVSKKKSKTSAGDSWNFSAPTFKESHSKKTKKVQQNKLIGTITPHQQIKNLVFVGVIGLILGSISTLLITRIKNREVSEEK